MYRGKQTKLNIGVSLLYQLVAAVIGLILPRLILSCYGSEVNGLIQSINQLLSYTVILECGIGGVIVAAFYKPLADNDREAVSDIFNNTKSYFFKISIIYILYAIFLTSTVKLVIETRFDYIYVATLVVVLSVNNYFSYYFALPHQLLMKADQKIRVIQSTQILTMLLNFIICVWLMKAGARIHLVKLFSGLVFLINPIIYRVYASHHYFLTKKIYDKDRDMPRKTDGLIHHISFFIHNNTDILLLSIVRGVTYASVYSVYNAVINIMKTLLVSFVNGLSGAFGDMLARGERDNIRGNFDKYEAINTSLTFSFFTVCSILIVPFVQVYTKGIVDADYIQPVFALFLTGAGIMYSIRIPYGMIVDAAGHYRETRRGALLEMIINLVLSVSLVKTFGLSGVAIGTFFAMMYRTIYIVWYLTNNILFRPFAKFLVTALLNLIISVVFYIITPKFVYLQFANFTEFFVAAIKISVVIFPVIFGVNVFVYYIRNLMEEKKTK